MQRDWATGDACPRCGLFHDPASHGTHEHVFPTTTVTTCRAIVTIAGNCECGEKPPNMRFRLGPAVNWRDVYLRFLGLLGPVEVGD